MAEKIYDSEFEPSLEDTALYADFVGIVRQLRRDCPWDREQTHDSVKHLLIEEAYETVEAIDRADWDELKQELGDLLLHVVFHSAIAEQEGRFRLADVIEAETEKLVRRHPHVFGETEVAGVAEVLTNWEQIKMKEGTRTSALEGVPGTLPALLRAHRIQEKAAGVGFDFPGLDSAWQKVEEEIGELKQHLGDGASAEAREKEFGDLLFSLVNYARFIDVNPENALRRSNETFVRRFQHIEQRLAERGMPLKEADLAEMDRFWDEAKAREKEGKRERGRE